MAGYISFAQSLECKSIGRNKNYQMFQAERGKEWEEKGHLNFCYVPDTKLDTLSHLILMATLSKQQR